MKRTIFFTFLLLHIVYTLPEASNLEEALLSLEHQNSTLVIGQNLVVSELPTIEISKKEQYEAPSLSTYTQSLYDELALAEHGLSMKAFERALIGYYNLEDRLKHKGLITIIDFDQSSTKERLYIIDLEERKLLFQSLVAHGKYTGWDIANNFSNAHRSLKSSLGFYITAETYFGKFGYALRLDGQERGFNSNARSRGIVMHGANYVHEAFVNQKHRLGRSYGCPAIPYSLHKKIINQIKNGSLLYIHKSNAKYEAGSRFLNIAQANQHFSAQHELLAMH